MTTPLHSAPPDSAPAVCALILNALRGTTTSIALEGLQMALCELARATVQGQTHTAAVMLIENTIRYYDAFPESPIAGLTLHENPSGQPS